MGMFFTRRFPGIEFAHARDYLSDLGSEGTKTDSEIVRFVFFGGEGG